jgi:hypothetical protein
MIEIIHCNYNKVKVLYFLSEKGISKFNMNLFHNRILLKLNFVNCNPINQ